MTATRPPVAFARVRPSALATEAGAPCGLLAGQLAKVPGRDGASLAHIGRIMRTADSMKAAGFHVEPTLSVEVNVVTETRCRGWVRAADLDVVTLAQVREHGWAALDADVWGTKRVRELWAAIVVVLAIATGVTAAAAWAVL